MHLCCNAHTCTEQHCLRRCSASFSMLIGSAFRGFGMVAGPRWPPGTCGPDARNSCNDDSTAVGCDGMTRSFGSLQLQVAPGVASAMVYSVRSKEWQYAMRRDRHCNEILFKTAHYCTQRNLSLCGTCTVRNISGLIVID
jgi:hypothetical protein